MSTVHELEQRIKVLETLLGRGVEHLEVDEDGYLKISGMYFNTPYDAGYILDQYGNFIHSRDTATDNWNIQGNDNTAHLKVYFETGKIFTDDALVTTDSIGFEYPLIFDNGLNLWIGATKTATQHHTGATFISSGYSGSNGHPTAFISVPNSNNTGATNYGILHEGNFPDANATRTSNRGTSNNTNTSTTPKDLLTINHKTNTGKVAVIGKIPLLTNNQTSNCRIIVNGTEVAYNVTNATVVQQITLFGTADVTKGSTVPIKLQFAPQSGSTATVPAYNTYALMAFDLAAV